MPYFSGLLFAVITWFFLRNIGTQREWERVKRDYHERARQSEGSYESQRGPGRGRKLGHS